MELTVREQIAASVSGAGITALTMTPFDVVKGFCFFVISLIFNSMFSSLTDTTKRGQNVAILQRAYGSHYLLARGTHCRKQV